MSARSKIDTYRKLKLLAAESRHLRARLLGIFGDPRAGRRTLSSFSSHGADACEAARNYVISSSGTGDRAFCRSSVCVPLHSRCELVLGERSGTSKEETELGAVTDALSIVTSATDWRRLACIADSDLFACFVALLACLDAFAMIRLVQTSPALGNASGSPNSHNESKKDQFRATVGVELASIDVSGAAHHDAAAWDFAKNETRDDELGGIRRAGKNGPYCVRTERRHFDVGVTGEWCDSARDAVKLALYASLGILQDHVIEEWQSNGGEAALLLNEVARGSDHSGNLEVCMLDSVLRGGRRRRTERHPCSLAETPALRFRIEANGERVTITAPDPSKTNRSAVSRAPCANYDERMECAITDIVRIPFAISRRSIAEPHVGCRTHRSGLSVFELSWPLRCLPAATFLAIAANRALLQQNVILQSAARRPGSDDAAARLESSSGQHCANSDIFLWWSRSPFFSALAHPRAKNGMRGSEADLFSDENLPFLAAAVNVSAQNDWQCPDVIVMIARMRNALALPLRDFPDVTFEQTAVHDPAGRAHELAHGLYGDVDVFTKVQIRWSTPRGCFTASAVSDPALHAAHSVSRESCSTSSAWLSCGDAGFHRGPLPLLVAAICSLYDDVFSRTGTAGARGYPMLTVRSPNSRAELDFLLYSWFSAAPQIRCFSIGTKPPNAASGAPLAGFAALRDGETCFDVGPTMTRAMLFYDLLGQRVLFAETHAATAEDAVARVDQLAVEVNSPSHDFFRAPSPAGRRPFRSIEQLRHWQQTRERFLRDLLQVVAATREGSFSGSSLFWATEQARPVVRASMRTCVAACASEVGSLWTILEALVEASFAGTDAESTPSHSAPPVMCTRFIEDSNGIVGPSAANRGDADEELLLQRWLGGPDSKWNSRSLGKETVPPRAGILELQLYFCVPPGYHFSDGQPQTSAVVLRCRVDGLRGTCEATKDAEWTCESFEAGLTTVLTATSAVAAGVLPALRVLCRRALRHVYEEKRHVSLVSLLPGLSEVLGWCAAAAPLLGKGGYPPYDPRFYAAPKLLGELLQGVAGKYECRYKTPSTFGVGSASAPQCEGNADDYGGRESKRDEAQPTTHAGTVFYTSEPFVVTEDAREGGVAEVDDYLAAHATEEGVCGSQVARPPTVACTLYINGGAGHTAHAAEDVTDVKPSEVVVHKSESIFVLGCGVGHTKREAWRSAAWQAVRLQFPDVVAQLEAHRDMAELQRQPALLARLTPRDATGGVAGSSVAVVYKLRFAFFSSAAQLSSPETAVRCNVMAVRTDGSEARVYPTHAADSVAAAASAGEAFAMAAAAIRELVHRAAAPPSPASRNDAWSTFAGYRVDGARASPSPSSWGLSAPPAMDVRPYVAWRVTTHYAKSLWHAYAGALSVHLGGDVAAHLLSADVAELAAAVAAARGTQGKAPAWQRRAALSRVQLRVRPVHTADSKQTRDAARQTLWQPSITPSPSFSSSSVHTGTVTAFYQEVGCAASAADAAAAARGALSTGTLLEETPANLLARQSAVVGSTSPGKAASSLALLQAATRWLAEVVQQCRLSSLVREELRGLLCARAADVAHIQRSRRWTPAERVETLLLRWLGRPAHVWVRRADGTAPALSWIAEAVVQLDVALPRPHAGLTSGHTVEGDSEADAAPAEAGRSRRPRRDRRSHVWVAAHASGPTSDEAVYRLYGDVCAALQDVVPAEPHALATAAPPSSSSPRSVSSEG